jgi:hypothetical protein
MSCLTEMFDELEPEKNNFSQSLKLHRRQAPSSEGMSCALYAGAFIQISVRLTSNDMVEIGACRSLLVPRAFGDG